MSQPEPDVRLERWLLDVKARLASRFGSNVRAVYDGIYLGDRIAMPCLVGGALVELVAIKHDKGAVLALVAESHAAIIQYAEALDGIHGEVKRLHNAKRKFVHRVERMAAYLAKTYDTRADGAPRAALEQLARLFPEAKMMVGLETTFLTKEALDGAEVDANLDLRKGLRKRYPTKYAARVTLDGSARATLYDPVNGFYKRGESLDASQVGDAIDATVDIAEAVGETVGKSSSHCPDIGGFDLPDCNGIDLPDCGGCDF